MTLGDPIGLDEKANRMAMYDSDGRTARLTVPCFLSAGIDGNREWSVNYCAGLGIRTGVPCLERITAIFHTIANRGTEVASSTFTYRAPLLESSQINLAELMEGIWEDREGDTPLSGIYIMKFHMAV